MKPLHASDCREPRGGRLFRTLLVVLLLTACRITDQGDDRTSDPRPASTSPTARAEADADNTVIPDHTPTPTALPSPPDIIFYHGALITMTSAETRPTALAISGDRISAIGGDALIHLGDSDTILIDLDGHTLMPGFVDAHLHLNSAYTQDSSPRAVQREMLRQGITAGANLYSGDQFIAEMQAMEASGDLLVRLSLYMPANTNCGSPLGDWYRQFPASLPEGGMLHITGVKLFTDGGSCGNPAISVPYRDHTMGSGELWGEMGGYSLEALAAEADRSGYQVAIHAIGDRGLDTALNAIRQLGPNTRRHRIEHASLIRPDQFAAIAETGAVMVVSGLYPTCDDDWQKRLPDAAQEWVWPWRDLVEAADHMAWQSDWPYSKLDPFLELYGFVTRRDIDPISDLPCEPLPHHAAQTLDVETALTIMTMGGAYAIQRDHELGSLEVGKLADLIILSDNPLGVPPERLREIAVGVTLVGGQTRHCASGYESLCP